MQLSTAAAQLNSERSYYYYKHPELSDYASTTGYANVNIPIRRHSAIPLAVYGGM